MILDRNIITSVMHSAHRDGSLIWKSFQGKSA
ncbi:hypothetical protein E2C01_053895 [Portunus trituberculatus]|uniref:Uncharacterized protein n=1 Tax=Portunus trituberculatus TaxID=210409 RepID=A0A5B7GRQ1_PORTR|nr:hypothetical protein [Portunus trituberculatus]